jgi:hypothetical protein
MNPFSRNPFEILDNVGLHIAKRVIAYLYHNFQINPVLSRHLPRGIFVATILLMTFVTNIGLPIVLVVFALNALISIARVHADWPAIEAGWNADAYRTFNAKAMIERERIGYRYMMIVLTLVLLTIGLSAATSPAVTHSIAVPVGVFFIMELSAIFIDWSAAAELPEPDDGDAFAKPHVA